MTDSKFEGFSQRYADFPDYIVKITRDIWEGHGIGLLRDLYAPDIPVRMPGGLAMGNRSAIEATMATMSEFPDRTLLADDVIWCGDAETGYLSSHRITSTGTHLGHGAFAEALGGVTGRPFRVRAIADCAARNGVIDDEWLIRDTGAFVRQLGGDPRGFARALIEGEGDDPRAAFAPDVDVEGPYTSGGNDNRWGAAYAQVLERIMACDFDVIEREYDRACVIEGPGGTRADSWNAARRLWLPLRSSFPRATFTAHHVQGREGDMRSPRAAIRWSLTGEHSGWGAFGKPTGAEVHVMGISHAEFGPWGLRREYVLFDEVAIWKQIEMALRD